MQLQARFGINLWDRVKTGTHVSRPLQQKGPWKKTHHAELPQPGRLVSSYLFVGAFIYCRFLIEMLSPIKQAVKTTEWGPLTPNITRLNPRSGQL